MSQEADPATVVLIRYDRGELSGAMALAHLLIAYKDAVAVQAVLRRCGEQEAWLADASQRLLHLLWTNRAGVDDALAVLKLAETADVMSVPLDEGIAECRRLFDQAVTLNPQASVAVYSLGSSDLLAAATDEVVGLLRDMGIIGPDRHLLDIGCGIGRFEAALAPHVASITGIDVSPAMIREARARCEGLANVRLLETSGRDLSGFADGAFDAVIAVDSFPYLYQAGGPSFASAILGEAARVIRPGGDIVVLNLSYRGDSNLDGFDARRMGIKAGLELRRAGTADLRNWDGRTFHWRKPG